MGFLAAMAVEFLSKILGKGSRDGESGESIYIAGMWGDDYSRSRVGSNKGDVGGEDIQVRKPFLTTVCFVQPDLWTDVAKDNRMRRSGFISRISLVIPKSHMGTRLESSEDKPLDYRCISPLKEAIMRMRRWKSETAVIVSFSKEAAYARREFYNAIEIELAAGGRYEDVKDIATKATSIAARIALIFALLDLASVGELPSVIPDITLNQWQRAQALEVYFLSQAIDSQRAHSRTGKNHLLQKVASWISKQKLPKDKKEVLTILASQIAKGVRGTKTEDIEDHLLPELLKACWIRQAGKARGGSMKYEINPRILNTYE